MRAWIGLLDDTGDSFRVVYEAVKKFLVPVETNDHPFYRFTREISDEKPITALFPKQIGMVVFALIALGLTFVLHQGMHRSIPIDLAIVRIFCILNGCK